MCLATATNSGFAKQFSCTINDIVTEFVFHPFANKWFILITQYGRVPNMYNVKFDLQRNDGVPLAMQVPIDNPQMHMSVPITTTCNFGADTDEIQGGIQFLVNKTKLSQCPSEIMIGLGIKELNGATLREVAKILNEILA